MSNKDQILIPVSRTCEGGVVKTVQNGSIISLQADNHKWWAVDPDDRVVVRSGDGRDSAFRFKVEVEKNGLFHLRSEVTNKLVVEHHGELAANGDYPGDRTRLYPILHASSGWSLCTANGMYLGRYLDGRDFIMANKENFDAHTGFAVNVLLAASVE